MPIVPSSFVRLAVIAGLLFLAAGCSHRVAPLTGTVTPSTPVVTPADMGTPTSMNDGVQYTIKNVASGGMLGISGQSQAAGAALSLSASSSGTDQLWHVMPMATNQYNVEDMLTHQVLGIRNASTVAGAAALQWADNGTADHLWTFYLLADGNYLIQNAHSRLYLEEKGANTTAAAVVDQNERTTGGAGCTCQEWVVRSDGKAPYPAPLTVSGTGIYVHDPYMMKDASGMYWLYGTHNTLASSTDMSNFVKSSPDISPDFNWWKTENTTGKKGLSDIWAPSLMAQNGLYYQYYSLPIYSTPSSSSGYDGAHAVIALATSNSPNGPWADQGQIIESYGNSPGSTTGFNAIDPAPFFDSTGKLWLVFGSWNNGIHIFAMDPVSGRRLASDQTIYTIAQRGSPSVGEEGAFIYPYNGYFYYFASINVCCAGTASTYRIIVGRSMSPTGPYLDRGGLDLMQGGGTILLSSHGTIYGPGGQSLFADGTQPILVYHYYDGANNGRPTLGINRLGFGADGWPVVE